MNQIIIHVGLHKTGTTFLQQNIFKPNCNTFLTYDRLTNILDADIISYEEFSGKPHSDYYSDSFVENMNNIKRVFNNPKIIIGFRDKKDIQLSLYKQYLHGGGTKKFKDYLKQLDPNGFNWKWRIDIVNNLFGKENVFIYTQEELANNLADFIIRLEKFTNIEFNNIIYTSKNVGVSTKFQVEGLRLVNHIFPYNRSNIIYKVLRKLKLLPSDFFQYYLKFIPSKKFNPYE